MPFKGGFLVSGDLVLASEPGNGKKRKHYLGAQEVWPIFLGKSMGLIRGLKCMELG